MAATHDYRVLDICCRLGPQDASSEKEYPAFRVCAVLSGTFGFRSSLVETVAASGSLLMGNERDYYSCRHPTCGGDRCVAFDFSGNFLEKIRSGLGAVDVGERFRRGHLPPSPDSAAIVATMDLVSSSPSIALEEAAMEVAAAAILASHETHVVRKVSARDEYKISLAARYMQAHFADDCTIGELARHAGMSDFHFLRTFRRVTGQTPHQHVLAIRLKHAARKLMTTDERVIDVASTSGFGDLSNFNAAFMRAFGVPPVSFRNKRRVVLSRST